DPAEDGDLVGDLRLPGHQLAEVHARDVGPDGAKFTAILAGGIWLQVVHVQVGRPAAEMDHDDRLLSRPARRGRFRAQAEGGAAAQPAQRQGPDTQEIAPRDPSPRRGRTRLMDREHETLLDNIWQQDASCYRARSGRAINTLDFPSVIVVDRVPSAD